MNELTKRKDYINTNTYISQTENGTTLGNVRVLLSDVKIPADISSSRLTVNYTADVINAANYYPYGEEISKQTWTGGYNLPSLFGYNGMLKDNHIAGEGNAYYTLFREYDPILGRWWSADPMRAKYAGMSPYLAFGANPVMFTDVRGDDAYTFTDEPQKVVDDLNSFEQNRPKSDNYTGNLTFSYSIINSDLNLYKINALKSDETSSMDQWDNTMFEMTINPDKHVLLLAYGDMAQVTNNDNNLSYIIEGAYLGHYTPSASTIFQSSSTVSVGVAAINKPNLRQFESIGFMLAGEVISHEFIESYLSAKSDLSMEDAHSRTLLIQPKINTLTKREIFNFDQSGRRHKNIYYSMPGISEKLIVNYIIGGPINGYTLSPSSIINELFRRR